MPYALSEQRNFKKKKIVQRH